MDFGLDAFVTVTPLTPANTPPQAAAGGVEGDATAFAAHLVDTEGGVAPEPATLSSKDVLAANVELPCAPIAIPLQPAQILLQLIGGGAATGDASAETEVGGEAAVAPAAPGASTAQIGADAAKSAPAFAESKPQLTPAATAPLLAPAAKAEVTAAPAPDDAAAPPISTAPTTKPTDIAFAANSAAAPSPPVSVAKPLAKSGSAPKSDVVEAAPPAAVADALENSSEETLLPARDVSTNRDPRAGAPQFESRNARAEPTFAPSADNGAAPTPAPQASSTPSALAPAITIGVGDSAAMTTARAPEIAPVATQVAQEIVRRFDGDTTRFEVRLDPPELGRVEVRLEVTRDNKVSATVVADSPQTLVELARHARDLQNSLQAAGLDLADNGLSFDLRDSGREAHNARSESHERGSASANDCNSDATTPRRHAVGLDPWRGRTLDMTA